MKLELAHLYCSKLKKEIGTDDKRETCLLNGIPYLSLNFATKCGSRVINANGNIAMSDDIKHQVDFLVGHVEMPGERGHISIDDGTDGVMTTNKWRWGRVVNLIRSYS